MRGRYEEDEIEEEAGERCGVEKAVGKMEVGREGATAEESVSGGFRSTQLSNRASLICADSQRRVLLHAQCLCLNSCASVWWLHCSRD